MKRDNGRGKATQVAVVNQGRNHSVMTMVYQVLAGLNFGIMGNGSSLFGHFGVKGERIRFNRSKYSPHQGGGERARRRRQIAKGQLTVSNGLVFNDPSLINKRGYA